LHRALAALELTDHPSMHSDYPSDLFLGEAQLLTSRTQRAAKLDRIPGHHDTDR